MVLVSFSRTLLLAATADHTPPQVYERTGYAADTIHGAEPEARTGPAPASCRGTNPHPRSEPPAAGSAHPSQSWDPPLPAP